MLTQLLLHGHQSPHEHGKHRTCACSEADMRRPACGSRMETCQGRDFRRALCPNFSDLIFSWFCVLFCFCGISCVSWLISPERGIIRQDNTEPPLPPACSHQQRERARINNRVPDLFSPSFDCPHLEKCFLFCSLPSCGFKQKIKWESQGGSYYISTISLLTQPLLQ